MNAVAAIDIGTNSTNLLVAAPDGSTVVRRVEVTRLGHGVDATRRLDERAVARTLDVLADYRAVLDRHGVDRWRVVATSATRDASNVDEFFTAVADRLGRRPELLTGEAEGRLAHCGALDGLSLPSGTHVVVDIGGGSTELVVGRSLPTGVEFVEAISLDVGAVRITERHLRSDPPRPDELSNAIGDVADLVDDTVRNSPSLAAADRWVGIAGTILTAAAVEVGQSNSDADALHGFELTRAAMEDVFRTLATEPLADRIHNPGLPRDRADVIVGGLCVLVALARRVDLDVMTVSSRNLLDGACAELLGGEHAVGS